MTPIAALLDREIYYLESDQLGSYVHLGQRQLIEPKAIFQKTHPVVEFAQTPALLMLDHPVSQVPPLNLQVTDLAQFDRSLIPEETYHLYLIQNKTLKAER